MNGTCELCGEHATHCDSVPDPAVPGRTPAECGYRLVPLCWWHAMQRKEVATSRLQEIIVYKGQGYIDIGRASQHCICEFCGQEYGRHRAFFDYCPTQVILCGDRTAKL